MVLGHTNGFSLWVVWKSPAFACVDMARCACQILFVSCTCISVGLLVLVSCPVGVLCIDEGREGERDRWKDGVAWLYDCTCWQGAAAECVR